jgi:hypothetical protein
MRFNLREMAAKRILFGLAGMMWFAITAGLWAQPHYEEVSPAKMAELRAAAEKGDAFAEDKYANACEGRLDVTNALIWYRRAAEHGVANAQANLARMLMTRASDASGKVVSPALADEAIGWYAKAAGYGNRRAQFELGRYYETGTVVARDLAEAFKWYSLAKAGSPREISVRPSLQRVNNEMTPEQLADGKKRLEKFYVRLEPALVNEIKLASISGEAPHRRANINGREFKSSDEQKITIEGRAIKVRCLEVRAASALVTIEGVEKAKELTVR